LGCDAIGEAMIGVSLAVMDLVVIIGAGFLICLTVWEALFPRKHRN
jgi:hypothetical protein